MDNNCSTGIFLSSDDGGTCTIIPSRGGLITSWRVPCKGGSKELLWLPSAIPSVGWPNGGIPLMFPFAGRVRQGETFGQYKIETFSGPMPIHGFLYDRTMEIVSVTPHSASLRRRYGCEDLKTFPFAYAIDLTITLATGRLNLVATIENQSHVSIPELGQGVKMPIAVGVHPFWNIQGEDPVKSTVLIPASWEHSVINGKSGPGGRRVPSNSLALESPILRSGIFSGIEADQTTLRLASGLTIRTTWSPRSAGSIHVVWSDLREGYFCNEPWMAMPDAVHDGGAQWLAPGESTVLKYEFLFDCEKS